MDLALLLDHLNKVEQHITSGYELIDLQRKVVADLAQTGFDTTAATSLLDELERMQCDFIIRRTKIEDDIKRKRNKQTDSLLKGQT